MIAVVADHLGELDSELVFGKAVDVDEKGIGLAVAELGNNAGNCRSNASLVFSRQPRSDVTCSSR